MAGNNRPTRMSDVAVITEQCCFKRASLIRQGLVILKEDARVEMCEIKK